MRTHVFVAGILELQLVNHIVGHLRLAITTQKTHGIENPWSWSRSETTVRSRTHVWSQQPRWFESCPSVQQVDEWHATLPCTHACREWLDAALEWRQASNFPAPCDFVTTKLRGWTICHLSILCKDALNGLLCVLFAALCVALFCVGRARTARFFCKSTITVKNFRLRRPRYL